MSKCLKLNRKKCLDIKATKFLLNKNQTMLKLIEINTHSRLITKRNLEITD